MIGKEFLKNVVLKPLFERVGTVAATWLLVGGDWMCANLDACGLVTEGGANTVVAYVIAVALLCADLAISWVNRKKEGGK